MRLTSTCTARAFNGVWQHTQPSGFDLALAVRADSVLPLVEALESAVDRGNLVSGRIVDSLEHLVIRGLNCLIRRIRDQRIVGPGEIAVDTSVAIRQYGALFDQAVTNVIEVRLWQ